MSKFQLIGQNIQKSLSPLFHNTLFSIKKLPFQYSLYLDLEIPTISSILQDKQFGGLSVTIPYKKHKNYLPNFHKEVEFADEICHKIGVFNTIIKTKQSHIKLFNTDYFGIQQTLRPKINNTKIKSALVLGAGATAQTILLWCQKNNIQTSIINRTIQKAQQLKSKFSIIQKVDSLSNIQDLSYKHIDIVFNTLPCTILQKYFNKIKKIYQEISSLKLIFDVNYRYPIRSILSELNTQLNSQIKIIDGTQMLIFQAILQNHIFCTHQIENLSQQQVDKQAQILYEKAKPIIDQQYSKINLINH